MKDWISVKDELPDYDVVVLCYYVPRAPIMEGRTYGLLKRLEGDKKITRGLLDKNGFALAAEVTHFQYLIPPDHDQNIHYNKRGVSTSRG